MVATEDLRPFSPGFGTRPLYFAGRQDEIHAIKEAIVAIKGRAGRMAHSPDPPIVLVGPRGVGKTVLLGRAIKDAVKRGIFTAKIDSKLLAGPEKQLVSRMLLDIVLKQSAGMDSAVSADTTNTNASVDVKEVAKGGFSAAMKAILSKNPMLLVMDEAHTCDTDSLNMLFGVVQSCMRSRLPLALIIAGTPGLGFLLQRCKATYADRSEFLRINTLSDDEAKEALSNPAKEVNRPMKPGALKLLHGWADNYPYFIQLAGKRAWLASIDRGGKDITIADAKAGLAEADKDRKALYGKRHTELKKRHIADHAVQVVKIMRKHGGQVDIDTLENRLMEINEGMDYDRAMEVVEELQEVGFIWQSDEGVEPGILSMFDFLVREHVTS